MKIKTKNINRLWIIPLCMLFFIIPMFSFLGCNQEPQMSEEEKLEKVIENTTEALMQTSNDIMKTQTAETLSLGTPLTAELPQYEKHLNFDRGSNEQAYLPAKQMTVSFGYYALNEYYLTYIPLFVGKTLEIGQSYYPDQSIWTKTTLDKDEMNLYIWTEHTYFEEFINISVKFDRKTLIPKSFTHYEHRNWTFAQDTFGVISVDFAADSCKVETLKYATAEEVDYSTQTEEFILANTERYICEQFSFANYKERTTTIYASHQKDITSEQLVEAVRNFDHAYTRENKDIFDFDNTLKYAFGDHAMDFAFDKYLILQDAEGNLTKVRN